MQGQPGVELRVVQLAALELPVLVMLDQAVVGVARKGQRIQAERVHHRQLQQLQVGTGCRQVRPVEGDEVVAKDECRRAGEFVEHCQSLGQVAATEHTGIAGVAEHAGKGMDRVVRDTDFEVDGNAARRKRRRFRGPCLHIRRRTR